ncbi:MULTISPECIES: hypothetical protein [unclassified Micromonospora]|uniref:hypothetical protein n=1 Tax=unclassified Micromonospora TaxID=2617518 RepID=UPI003690BDB3|nr:hypothetical protein OG990_27860 [Micromonospora sp. NBC_00858]
MKPDRKTTTDGQFGAWNRPADQAISRPLEQLAWLGAGALAAVLVTVGVGLLFLQVSTAVEELRTA